MKIALLITLGIICTITSLYAQSRPEIKPLTIGDTISKITLNHIVNFQSDSVNFSSLRGKVVILDFFATWCSPCIDALGNLDSLQRHFGSKLQAMVVDYEPAATITYFLKTHIKIKRSPLLFVANDSILHRLFPHHAMPHEVIIDREGVVRAITYVQYVTQQNIQAVIDGRKLNLPLKKELDYKRNVPLLYNGNGGNLDNISIRSTFCNYIDGLEMHYGFFKDSVHQRIYYTNGSILRLYYTATNETLYPNRVILEVKDSTHYINYFGVPYNLWRQKNTYCYELIAPRSMPSTELHTLMFNDLNRYLHINGRFEKRRVSCWILTRTTEDSSLYKTRGGPERDSYDSKARVYKIRNLPMSWIIDEMNSQYMENPPIPIVLDSTGYKGRIDMNLKVKNLQDITGLKTALRPYGFQLVKTNRVIKMLVLTETSKYRTDLKN